MEKQDVPKKRNPFILSCNVVTYIWTTFLLLVILFSLITSIALAYTNGFFVWSVIGYYLMKMFMGVWIILVFLIIGRILFDINKKEKKKKAEKQIKLREELKLEILKELKNGRTTSKR